MLVSPVGTARLSTPTLTPCELLRFAGNIIAIGVGERSFFKKLKTITQYIISGDDDSLANFTYLHQYYLVYPKEYAHDWQYGYKEVSYVWETTSNMTKYFTRDYGEPYIFFFSTQNTP